MPRTASLPPVASSPAAIQVPPVRRSQQERRTTTRLALLDAAAACLVDHGVAGTTTTLVVERAGVSQGALFKHFATKQDLLTATAQHLYEQLVARYLERFATLAAGADRSHRLDGAIRLLWEMFASPELAAALDLTNASRTDPELATRLDPVITAHAARVRSAAVEILPELTTHRDFPVTFDLILETMTGMAMSHITDEDEAHYERLVDHLSELAHQRLGGRPGLSRGLR